jgi:histidinol-phosphatase (PHP family)
MPLNNPAPWKVSLHGGHSRDYCDHAQDSLRDVLEAAVQFGYHTFGVTEHAPRLGDRYLYENERQRGWDVPKIEADFERYGAEIGPIVDEFSDRLIVLRGFEIEVVPPDTYIEVMTAYRDRHRFEYMVGSVHFMHDRSIDGPQEDFDAVTELEGGLERLAVSYYRLIAEMVQALQPEVVGHLDLIRKNAPSSAAVDTPAIRRAAEEALETIREANAILDLNTAGYRKGLGAPYVAPWLLERAKALGIGICFGDDSHCIAHVGEHILDARDYLLANGIDHVDVLTRDQGELVRRKVPLE